MELTNSQRFSKFMLFAKKQRNWKFIARMTYQIDDELMAQSVTGSMSIEIEYLNKITIELEAASINQMAIRRINVVKALFPELWQEFEKHPEGNEPKPREYYRFAIIRSVDKTELKLIKSTDLKQTGFTNIPDAKTKVKQQLISSIVDRGNSIRINRSEFERLKASKRNDKLALRNMCLKGDYENDYEELNK